MYTSSIPIGQIVQCFCSQQNSLKNDLRLGQMKVKEERCVCVFVHVCVSYWEWLLPLKLNIWLLSCNLHSSKWLLMSRCEYTRTLVTTPGYLTCWGQIRLFPLVLSFQYPQCFSSFFLTSFSPLFLASSVLLHSFSFFFLLISISRFLYSSLYWGGLLQTNPVSRQHWSVLVCGQIWQWDRRFQKTRQPQLR